MTTPVTRRFFLKSSASAAAAALLAKFNVAFAAAPGDKRFVFIILRGAMDGLAAVPAYRDPAYAAARGRISLPSSAFTSLDGFFGLHNSLSGFGEMFRAHEAAVVHAVATPYRDRSHFDAQNVLESGAASPRGARDGWLNRALSLYGSNRALGLAVGQTVPLALQGAAAVGTWAPSSDALPEDTVLVALDRMYRKDPVFHAALTQAVDVHDVADSALEGMNVGNGGRNLRHRRAMAATATAVGKILAEPKGPRIATIEMGGWDTHAQQGLESGILANNLAALDECFSSLKKALGSLWPQTVVLAATEFGRTVAMNGTKGTDHGTASAALIAGGAVSGGRVITRWPGLDKAQLHEGRDLRPTTDLRQVAKAVLTDHLGFDMDSVTRDVFPGSDATRPIGGLIRV